MVEIMCAALTGSHFGWEANSVLNADGDPPNLGHVLIAIDPGATSEGSFLSRISSLLTAVAAEPEVRLPGLRRLEARALAAEHGLDIPAALYREISTLSENQN
jgi:(2R)-3-sulfolactate dehydrogenase (NADP+)